MASASRDRVTIDLRGIGDAVRAAAAGQGISLSQLARRALVADLEGGGAPVQALGSDGQTLDRSVAKLMLRMPRARAQALILSSHALGLSYGEYVARLVEGSKLPQLSAEREADRAALLASTDQLAVMATDLHAFMRLLSKLDLQGMEPYRGRMHSLDADLRRHIDLASRLIAGRDDSEGAMR